LPGSKRLDEEERIGESRHLARYPEARAETHRIQTHRRAADRKRGQSVRRKAVEGIHQPGLSCFGRLADKAGVPSALLLQPARDKTAGHQRGHDHEREESDCQRNAPLVCPRPSSHHGPSAFRSVTCVVSSSSTGFA
jgi:hypothetical protein